MLNVSLSLFYAVSQCGTHALQEMLKAAVAGVIAGADLDGGNQ
jgi:hypothetical protein